MAGAQRSTSRDQRLTLQRFRFVEPTCERVKNAELVHEVERLWVSISPVICLYSECVGQFPYSLFIPAQIGVQGRQMPYRL